jgi:hypothetical protein
MKRLSSYAIYIYVLVPLAPIFVLIESWDSIRKGEGDSILAVIVTFSFAIYFIYVLSRSKRVFYKEGNLYVYELFSNKMKILSKDNIGVIETFFPFSPFIWRIVYYNENMDRKVIFLIRNALCDNFDDIVEEF